MKKLLGCCMNPSTSDDVSPSSSSSSSSPLALPFPFPVPPPILHPPRLQRRVIGPRPTTFTLKELQTATQEWDATGVIGRGRTSTVFSGKLKNKQTVAVKRLQRDPNMEEQFSREYRAEKTFLHQLYHENIIVLKGFCNESKEMILVLDFISKGSVYDHLHDDRELLGWENRMKIALGAARAMDYMHHVDLGPIVHRDIKTTDILIDETYNTKLCDFGSAIYEPTRKIYNFIVGTEPYIAPEYQRDNILSTKCDIHGFGVVLLELITGRKPAPEGETSITDWANVKLIPTANWDQLVPGMIDERIREMVPPADMMKSMKLATDCIRRDYSERPESDQVVARLLEISCLATAPSSSGGGIACLADTIPETINLG